MTEKTETVLQGRFRTAIDAGHRSRRKYRNRSFGNLLRMGHCAPAVVRTLLDISGLKGEEEWLVKLVAGLPGGIGNTGGECGGITSPLVMLGLRHGLGSTQHGLPLVIHQGLDHFRRFVDFSGTHLCKEIRGPRQRLLPCIKAVRHAPEIYAETVCGDSSPAIQGEAGEAYGRLYSEMAGKGFHCAQAVFQCLPHLNPPSQELLDATSGFIGGTLFKGLTCSALTAGVMAVGLRRAQIETSRLRVMRQIVLLLAHGDAFADKINKFNKSMNAGNSLSLWFTGEFGRTQCRVLTGTDFFTNAGVSEFIEGDGVRRCRAIAEKVAAKVQDVLAS